MKMPASAVALAFALAAAPDSHARTRIAGDAAQPEARAAAKTAKKSRKAAKDGTSQTTWTGPEGRQATATTTRSAGDANTTITGPDGKTVTRTTTY